MKLTTERLLLRPWRAEDLDTLAWIHADPDVMRWVGYGSTRDREQTADDIERWSRHLEQRGFCFAAAEERSSGELMGMVGLSVPDFLPEILPVVEIGWRLRRDRWGEGLAPEGARACVEFAFGELGLGRLVAICHRENRPSQRVAEKLGMRAMLETVVPKSGALIVVYELERGLEAG